jgi:molybdenum cofactor cytidylyltransferase
MSTTKDNPIRTGQVRAEATEVVVALGKVPVGAVVLAAGESRRMGEPKQLLPVGGQPMVRQVTEAVCAVGVAQVVVVIGAHAEAVGQAVAGLPVEMVLNDRWPEGMTASLHAGLRALRPEIRAALVVLADQPGLTAELIQALADCYRATGAPVVAPFSEGERGRPVLFDRALFPELLAAMDDKGRREIIARYWDRMARVEVEDPAILRDVDTRQDYEEIR